MIGIVGGGLTGLSLAHELARRGVDHVVLEADVRPGGVIRSGRIEGRLLEWGPQRARLVASLDRYVRELGLEGDVILADPDLPLYVYAAGKLREVPSSGWGWLGGDLLTWGAKVRMAFEILTAGPRPEETVADFLVRKLGRQPYERIAGPLYGGLYASDPADMVVGLSLGPVLRELGVKRSLLLPLLVGRSRIDGPAACSFTHGMQTVTDALYEANRDAVRLSTPVERIRPGERRRWAVETPAETVEVEEIVLTCPAEAAARILADVAPHAAGAIASLHYNPLAVVHLHADTDLEGFGYQVSLEEDLATRGVTWNDSLFDRDGVYTAYLGGAKRPGVVEELDDRIGEIATQEFERITGHGARVLAVARVTMPAWDRSWAALKGLEVPRGIRLAASWESRPGIPGRLAQANRLAEALTRQASARSRSRWSR
ncbi:MAG: protoporphyrinogen oxidase [Gemmatimonadetes bacterium]|nr:protoporphyrinogen oxidase [Gemmatimonadota bacterium]